MSCLWFFSASALYNFYVILCNFDDEDLMHTHSKRNLYGSYVFYARAYRSYFEQYTECDPS